MPFEVNVDPENPVVSILIGDREILLTEGEFSEFVEVEFEMVPHLVTVPGIVRFFLKSVRPDFVLYASPVQINPADQALPITDPPGYGRELVDAVGLFYTQGMAEDTKALENGVFGNREFTELSQIIFDERMKAYRYELDRFEERVPLHVLLVARPVPALDVALQRPAPPGVRPRERPAVRALHRGPVRQVRRGARGGRWRTWTRTRRSSCAPTTGSRRGTGRCISTSGSATRGTWCSSRA